MVTVADIVSVRELGLTSLWQPDPSPPVRWVAATELDDPTPFLEGGELLLTTGLGTHEWSEEWDAYVARLAARGAVGLGLGTGLTHAEVPSSVADACRRHGMALVEVPRDIGFVAVSRCVAELLGKEERLSERTMLESQRALVAAAARAAGGMEPSGDVSPLLAALASAVNGTTALLGRSGEVLVGPVGSSAYTLDPSIAAEEVGRLRARGGLGSGLIADRGTHAEFQPVGAGPRHDDFLAVLTAGPSGSVQRAAITSAVALLGVARDGGRRRRSTERDIRRRAVQLAVASDPVSADVVLQTFPGGVSLPRTCRVVRLRGEADVVDDALHACEGRGALAAVLRSELVALVDERQVAGLVTRLAALDARIGVGEPVPTASLGRSFENAGFALNEASDSVRVVTWEHLVGHGALAVLDRPRAEAFARSFLQPLDESLRATLHAFVKHHGSRARVASDLGLHRNTVRSRIDEIETALGLSLDDPQVRTSAWIALQLVTRDPSVSRA